MIGQGTQQHHDAQRPGVGIQRRSDRLLGLVLGLLLAICVHLAPAAEIPTLTGTSGLNLGDPDWYYTVPYNTTKGPLRTLLLFTDFNNVLGTSNPDQPMQLAADLFEINGDSNGVIDHFGQQSYGNHTVQLQIDYAWHRMPENFVSGSYPESGRPTNYIHDALLVAQAAGHDMSDYDLVYLFMPKGVSPNSPTHYFTPGALPGVTSPPKVVITFGDDAQSSWTRKQLVMHETGHAMGMPDLYMYSGGNLPANANVMGPWDIMGNNWEALGYCSWTRHYWGWLAANRKDYVPTGSQAEFLLSPLDGPSGTSMIVLPGANFPDDVLVIENPTPFKPSVAKGVLIYTVDSTVATGEGGMRIAFPDGVTSAYADDVLWQPGSSFTDPATGSLIEILAANGADFRVRVRAGPQITREVTLVVSPDPGDLYVESPAGTFAHGAMGASIGSLDPEDDTEFQFVFGASL